MPAGQPRSPSSNMCCLRRRLHRLFDVRSVIFIDTAAAAAAAVAVVAVLITDTL